MSFPARDGAPAARRQTDFGREMSSVGALSLAEALRDRAWRMARTEAYRFQIAMGLLGFVGGLVIVVPAVLWLTASGGERGTGVRLPAGAGFNGAAQATAAELPTLIKAPALAAREVAIAKEQPAGAAYTSDVGLTVPSSPPSENEHAKVIAAAQELMRARQVLAARTFLSQPQSAHDADVRFLMAETYDPNVLAALGVTDVHADTEAARGHYEAALALGVAAAAQRLEALE